MPPIKIPMQIMYTLLGKIGMGPHTNMPTKKKTVPADTIFWKFFFGSGMKLSAVDVRVYVMVSIEKMMPINHTEISSSFSLS